MPSDRVIREFFGASYLGVTRANVHLLALDQVYRRVEDDLIALLDAVAHLDLFPQIARHRYFPDVNDPVLDSGDLRPLGVENDRIGWHQDTGGLARDAQFDGAVGSWSQRAVRIGNVDLGQQRPRPGLQRVGDPRDLAREGAIRNFRHMHDRIDPGRQSERLILRYIDLGADHVAPHDGEYEGAADRVGFHERAHVDVALSDHAVERRHDPLIGLLLGEHLNLSSLRRCIGFGHSDRRLLRLEGLHVDGALLRSHPALVDQWAIAPPGHPRKLLV